MEERLSLSVPLGKEECQIEISLPSSALDEYAWPKRASAVLARRLVTSHGLPCYVQADIEGVLQFHMDKLKQVAHHLSVYRPYCSFCVAYLTGLGAMRCELGRDAVDIK